MNIGKKLRTLRLGLELTQQELANRLGLTKGYISQVENNLTSPSLQTLFQILEVLGSNVHSFFSNEEEQMIVCKKENQSVHASKDLKHMLTEIAPHMVKFEMEPVIIDIEPSGQSEMHQAHPGEEFGYVLDGQIVLVFNQKRYILRKGESFYFQANKEHYLLNQSQMHAKVLWVESPPKH